MITTLEITAAVACVVLGSLSAWGIWMITTDE